MLTDLLVSPNAYNISHGGPSKGITYLPNKKNFHLTERVKWKNSSPDGGVELASDVSSDELQSLTDPIFIGRNDHGGKGHVDGFLRGGLQTNLNRRKLDIVRISKFLYSSPQGGQFLLRQGILQLLNPQVNTRTFNAGVSLLAQIGAGSEVRFKRHGLLPEPVDFNYNETIGRKIGDKLDGWDNPIGEKLGDFVENAFGGDYLSLKREQLREDTFGLGDPAKPSSDPSKLGGFVDAVFGDVAGHFQGQKNKTPYNVKVPLAKLDRTNATEIFGNFPLLDPMAYVTSGKANKFATWEKDFVNFRFDVINSDNVLYKKSIVFRAFLENFGDNYTANHNSIKMNGRGEIFYTYNSFARKVSINFKIAAQSRDEMKPIYQKLNYLVAQTAPNYSAKGRIRTPYVKLTMGDYLRKVPGLINSVNVNWNKDYPWEIKLDPKGLDRDMKVLPHVLDVNVQFTPIHNFVPSNEVDTPFISLEQEGDSSPDWLPYNTKPGKQVEQDNNPSQASGKTASQGGKVCDQKYIGSGYYLSHISQDTGFSVEEIAEFNDIPTNEDAYRSLQDGETIYIPCKP